jgi:hypothetical protein
MPEGFFTEGNSESFREQAKRTKVEFSASKESLGYLSFPSVRPNPEGRS